MSNPGFWRRWAAVASAASVLALLGGCVVAPVDPWDVGEPVAVSGTVYYGNAYRSYPDYYYYYPAPSVSLLLHGHSYRGYRGARHPAHRRAERRHRRVEPQHRPHGQLRGENRSRHNRWSAGERRDAGHRRGNSGARLQRPAQRPRAGEGSRPWTGRAMRGNNRGGANRPSSMPAAGQPRRGNQLGSRQRGAGSPSFSRGGNLRGGGSLR